MMWKVAGVLVALFVLGFGILAFLHFVQGWAVFGESVAEVAVRYSPQFADKQQQLKRLVDKLPPPGVLNETKGPVALDPPIGIDPNTRRDNFSGAMDFECMNPDDTSHIRNSDGERFWMVISGGDTLVTMIRDMAPGKPYHNSRSQGGNLARRCEELLAKPYFVVCRAVTYKKPVVLPEKKMFLPGEVEMEAIIFDLRDEKVKACVRGTARNSVEKVSARFTNLKGDASRELMHDLAELVRKDTDSKLRALAGKSH